MRNLIGMLVGAASDRGDGHSGIKGAIIGSVAQSAARIATPLAVTFAVGWGVLHLVRRAAGCGAIGALRTRYPNKLTPDRKPYDQGRNK